MTAKVAFLDRILALYGAPARETRTALRGAVEEALTRMWPETKSRRPQLDPSRATGETLCHAIQNLIPQEENQRLLKSQASQIVLELGQTRWLLFEQSGTAVSGPLLTVVIAWLALIL